MGEVVFAYDDEDGRQLVCKGAQGRLRQFAGEIAQEFKLCELSVMIWADREEVGEQGLQDVRDKFGASLGSANSPLVVSGVLALWPGFKADFETSFLKIRPLQVLQELSISEHSGVYSVKIIDDGNEEEAVVLKIKFKDPAGTLTPSEDFVFAALRRVRASHGMTMPSLPELLDYGFFLGTEARLIKPKGDHIAKSLATPQLVKLAFDMLLALYHLFLVERRHRQVKPKHIVQQREGQFILLDFELARAKGYIAEGEVHDCYDLVISLAQFAGWNGKGGFRAASNILTRLEANLGEFARYAAALKPATALPNYLLWLHKFAALCKIDDAILDVLVKGSHPPPGWDPYKFFLPHV